MTPLARRITNELTLPLKRRTFVDRVGVLKNMDDVHCFEMSDVWSLVKEMAEQLHKQSQTDGKYNAEIAITEALSFLPAPKTWIEWTGDDAGTRNGVLLEEVATENGPLAHCTLSAGDKDQFESIYEWAMPLRGHADAREMRTCQEAPISRAQQISLFFDLYSALAFVNTPRIIGRRQHMPHRGFERDLVRAMKPVGKFPLHAWTEIKLEISPPKDMSDDGSHEAHLTGARALHFCRAHLRIRLGRLEIVRAHWRGDGLLGIKQSRYKLTMPRVGVQS